MRAEFSENLKTLRERNGLSQTELSKRLFVNKSLISAYENQERMPSLNMLTKLSYQFNVSMEFLLGINRNKTIDISNLTSDQVSAVINVVKLFEESNKKQR